MGLGGAPGGQRGTVQGPAQYVVQQVKDALAGDEHVAALDLRVRVVDDEVFVQGQVATPERRALVDALLRRLLPHARVHNDVRVLGDLEPADEEHLA
jgi:hypothetical protein